MTTPEVRADRRRRDRTSAWFAVLSALVYVVVDTVTDGFRLVNLAVILFGACWLLAEYEREWDAQREVER